MATVMWFTAWTGILIAGAWFCIARGSDTGQAWAAIGFAMLVLSGFAVIGGRSDEPPYLAVNFDRRLTLRLPGAPAPAAIPASILVDGTALLEWSAELDEWAHANGVTPLGDWIVGAQPSLSDSTWFDCTAALRTVDALAAAAREATDIPQSLHDDLAALRQRLRMAATNSARFHLRIGTCRQADSMSMDRHF